MTGSQTHQNYEQNGYIRVRNLFGESELEPVHETLQRFHEAWSIEHADYIESGSINSAYITGTKFLDETDRQVLFNFIGSFKIGALVKRVHPEGSMFIGTQLFFDPASPDRKNYWHRDGQYNNLTLDEQKASLRNSAPLHIRIALQDERGVELVPGSHYRWDTQEEFDVRMGNNDRSVSDDLSSGRELALNRGDALLFNANMLHRGLYGGDRFAFDLLFGEVDERYVSFVDDDGLPDEQQISQVAWPDAFLATARLKSG